MPKGPRSCARHLLTLVLVCAIIFCLLRSAKDNRFYPYRKAIASFRSVIALSWQWSPKGPCVISQLGQDGSTLSELAHSIRGHVRLSDGIHFNHAYPTAVINGIVPTEVYIRHLFSSPYREAEALPWSGL